MDQLFVGLDVAKDHLDGHVRPSGEAFVVTHDEAGLVSARRRGCRRCAPRWWSLKPRGAMRPPWRPPWPAPSLPVAVVNPRQIRDFARATGTLAKTDTLGRPRHRPLCRSRAPGRSAAAHRRRPAPRRARRPPASTRRDARGGDQSAAPDPGSRRFSAASTPISRGCEQRPPRPRNRPARHDPVQSGVAGDREPAPVRTWRGSDHGLHAHRRTPGTGPPRPPADRGPGRRRALQPR